jgi:hypothetical protein
MKIRRSNIKMHAARMAMAMGWCHFYCSLFVCGSLASRFSSSQLTSLIVTPPASLSRYVSTVIVVDKSFRYGYLTFNKDLRPAEAIQRFLSVPPCEATDDRASRQKYEATWKRQIPLRMMVLYLPSSHLSSRLFINVDSP